MEYKSDFLKEQEKLSKTENLLEKNISVLEKTVAKTFAELKEVSALYSEGEAGFYMEIPAAQQRYEQQRKELSDNEKAKLAPYFGKTIFEYQNTLEHGKGDKVLYFGKKGLKDYSSDEMNFVVTDWRAPVAEIYYSSKLGETSYTAPKGEIGVDLKLKTTIKIKNGELISLYDAEVVTNDELLCDYLSQNKDVVLNEIIATIQEDQNKIIRRPLSRNLIVQGVAGSGKTTVALHRIAYLLYNYKEQLQFNNLCLIAANKLFLNYITGMLPDLDVPAIKQKTIAELLFFAMRSINKKYAFTSNEVFDKSSDALEENTQNIFDNNCYIDYFLELKKTILQDIFEEIPIKFLRFELLSADEIVRMRDTQNISFIQKADILDKRMAERLATMKTDILDYVCANRNNETVIEETNLHFSLHGGAILEDSLLNKWLSFVKSYSTLFTKRVKSLNAKKLLLSFCGATLKHPTINELACFLRILTEINGNMMQDDLRHIVIDEAQDFSIAVYYALKGLYPNATFTVVGDIMQNIYQGGLQSWDILQNKVFGERTEYASLIKSYRNTIEISEFAKEVIFKLAGQTIEIEPIIRHGEQVKIHEYVTPPERLETLKNSLAQFNIEGFSLNAVICKTQQEAEKLFASFKNKELENIMLLDPEDGVLKSGNYIVSLNNVKGLEFDCVVVWDFDSFEKADVNRLYVALTRALHKLEVFSNKFR